jgi:hypothetical protein
MDFPRLFPGIRLVFAPADSEPALIRLSLLGAVHINGLIGSTGDLAQTGYVILVVFDAIERHSIGEISQRQVNAINLRDWHLIIL